MLENGEKASVVGAWWPEKVGSEQGRGHRHLLHGLGALESGLQQGQAGSDCEGDPAGKPIPVPTEM